jgi:hypothetical protein
MISGFTLRAPARPASRCKIRIGAAILAGIAWSGCAAQERTGMQVTGTYPYAASVLSAPKSLRVENGQKNLNEPVMSTIAPESSRPSAIVLPERRSAVDQMLQSHEITFGTSSRASNFSSKRPPVGTNLDLDAIKLRISRDKVLVKAEWSFN